MSSLTSRPARVNAHPDMAGFTAAFRMGDATGIRVAADWFRDRDQPETALAFDVLAFELEASAAEARQARFVLSRITKPTTRKRRRRVHVHEVQGYLDEIGIPATVRGGDETFIVVVPNDGQHTDTADRLTSLLCTVYPRAEFFVVLDNYSKTDLAGQAANLLYEFQSVS